LTRRRTRSSSTGPCRCAIRGPRSRRRTRGRPELSQREIWNSSCTSADAVDARQRWQALQTNLKIARERLDAGDHAAALTAAEAALAIDPDFLAAHSLRDRIVSATPAAAAPAPRPVVLPPPAPSVERLAPVEPVVIAEPRAPAALRPMAFAAAPIDSLPLNTA